MDSSFQMKDWLHYMPEVLGDASFTTYDFMTSPIFHHFQFWPRACTSKDPTVLCEARDYLVNGKGLVWQLSAFFGRSEGGQVQAVVCIRCSGLCSPPCGLMLRRNGEKDWPCSITEASKQQFFRLEVKLLNHLNRTG